MAMGSMMAHTSTLAERKRADDALKGDDEDESPSPLVVGAAAAGEELANAMVDQPVLKGISEVVSTGENPGSRLSSAAQGYASSFVPAFLADITAYLDPTVRSSRSKDPVEGTINAIKSRVPLLSRSVPAKRDALGRETKREQIWNPLYGSRSKSEFSKAVDVVEKFGIRLTMRKRTPAESEATYQERAARYGAAVEAAIMKHLNGSKETRDLIALYDNSTNEAEKMQLAAQIRKNFKDKISEAKRKVTESLKTEKGTDDDD
jgi:hypothetical protein